MTKKKRLALARAAMSRLPRSAPAFLAWCCVSDAAHVFNISR